MSNDLISTFLTRHFFPSAIFERICSSITKFCALVKDLDINVGNIININMNVISSTKRGRCRAHYVDVYNVGNGMRKEYSLNTIANMINKSLEIYRYQ